MQTKIVIFLYAKNSISAIFYWFETVEPSYLPNLIVNYCDKMDHPLVLDIFGGVKSLRKK